jgi:hypothetical protein
LRRSSSKPGTVACEPIKIGLTYGCKIGRDDHFTAGVTMAMSIVCEIVFFNTTKRFRTIVQQGSISKRGPEGGVTVSSEDMTGRLYSDCNLGILRTSQDIDLICYVYSDTLCESIFVAHRHSKL